MNILNKKVYFSIIILIIFLGIVYFVATTTNLYPINRVSLDTYDANTDYGLVMTYSKHGFLPVILKKAFIVDRSGDIISGNDLDFKWELLNTSDDLSGVVILDTFDQSKETWQTFINYKTTSKEIKLILKITPITEFSKTDDLYLELHYEVWGIKKIVRRLI